MGKAPDRRTYKAEWYQANRERILARRRAYEAANRERLLEQRRQYRAAHREARNAARLAAYHANPQPMREKANAAKRALRATVLAHYGNGSCSCCGETHVEFLALDHSNGGGRQHRAAIGRRSGSEFYRWIVQNDFPDGYRVLCHNCNMARGAYGYCPHEAAVTVPG
jgi:hypothetical protein